MALLQIQINGVLFVRADYRSDERFDSAFLARKIEDGYGRYQDYGGFKKNRNFQRMRFPRVGDQCHLVGFQIEDARRSKSPGASEMPSKALARKADNSGRRTPF